MYLDSDQPVHPGQSVMCIHWVCKDTSFLYADIECVIPNVQADLSGHANNFVGFIKLHLTKQNVLVSVNLCAY